ncbi:RNA-binding protein [Natranaeroarchaeum aerophilus]|uniref:RNA-binding protein n=1 Tax=Natranaeroarchaeum aerophilus TaxID=2917711 RepID=A0AAE3FQ90_9EURY|nr:RNA-binding protein [Natranaeroarchaeum aerophilus]MCL9813264.1 RNA-binding protein [Natranaeroarchaeum aerophilus]
MASVPFHYIDLRTFCYATEDEKRVTEALQYYLPEEFEVDRAESEGHYGDRIVVLSARVETADDMRHVLRRVADIDEVDRFLDELDQRVDENCSLFLSLDKQSAFNGAAAVGDGITLRAKVEAYPAKKAAAVENAREAIEGVRDDAF